MARLPDIQGESQQPVPQPAAGVASYEPPNWRQVGMAGENVSRGGRDMQEASQIVAAASDRQDQITALDAANKLKLAQLNLEQDPQDGFSNARGGQVVGPQFVSSYMDRWKQAQQQIADSLSSPSQKIAFGQHTEVMGLQFQSALLQHQAKQTLAFNAATRENTLDIGFNDIAAHPYDDATYGSTMALLYRTVMDGVKEMGYTEGTKAYADAVAVGSKKLESKALMYRTSGMLLDNPMKAADFFHQHELDFDANDRYHLAGQLKVSVDAQTSRVIGTQAVDSALATPPAPAVPANLGADIVKPFDSDRIGKIADQVKAPSAYDALFSKYAQAYGISPADLKMRAVVESGMNPSAKSQQGAVGLMQITPDTAKTLGIDPNDPEQAIKGAAMLIAKAGGTVGGDMSKVDRTYYGGNADAKGPNTDQYVENMRAVRGAIMGTSQAPVTQDMIEGSEGRVIDIAKASAEQQRPGDAVYRDQVISEARKEWAQRLGVVRGQNQQVVSQIAGMFASSTPPKAISDLPPALQAAYSQLPGTVQHQISETMLKGEQKLTPDSASLYYSLLGKSNTDAGNFAGDGASRPGIDLPKLFGMMPNNLWLDLVHRQNAIASKDGSEALKDATYTAAFKIADDFLRPAGMGTGAKPNTPQSDATERYHGQLIAALRQFKDQTGNWPKAEDTRKIAGSLMLPGRIAGSSMIFRDDATKFYELPDKSKFYIEPPAKGSDEYKEFYDKFQKGAAGKTVTDNDFNTFYSKWMIAHPDDYFARHKQR